MRPSPAIPPQTVPSPTQVAHLASGFRRMVALSFLQPVEKTGPFRENNVASKTLKSLSFAVAAAGLVYAAAPALAQQKTITVWFGKGFYKSEDDALLEAIKK